MSYEPIAERIRRHLIGLKMPRALEALQTVQSQIEQGQLTALEAIEALLGEEYSTRESRRIKMALQTARLTVLKTLAGYDFSFQPSLERSRVMALAELGFVERRQCVHFLGPPGTGKSHLAVALDWAWKRSALARACSSPRWPSWSIPCARPSAKAGCGSG